MDVVQLAFRIQKEWSCVSGKIEGLYEVIGRRLSGSSDPPEEVGLFFNFFKLRIIRELRSLDIMGIS